MKKRLTVFLVAIACLAAVLGGQAVAQTGCPFNLATPMGSNANYGISFEITFKQSTQLCRFWMPAYQTGTMNLQIWMHPNGFVPANDGLWVKLGEASINFPSAGVITELPIDLSGAAGVINTGTKLGFVIFSTTSGMYPQYANSVAPAIYSDAYMDINCYLYSVVGSTSGNTTNWTFPNYPRQFIGRVYYKEGCFIPSNLMSAELTDALGNPQLFAFTPGTAYIKYYLDYPAGPTNATYTATFSTIGTPPTVVYSTSFTVSKAPGVPLNGIQPISIPSSVPAGYYNVSITLNSITSCGTYANTELPTTMILLLRPGSVPCVVWPGDANRDDIVNWADRNALYQYILDANLDPLWLTGPVRYRADAATNPMTYYTWVGQSSVPWATPEGCHMDTDGNGVVNNYDYLAMKINWMKTTDTYPAPKGRMVFNPASFDMDQNYPNPFNPTTKIRYSVPEASMVTLTVTDMLGRTVATLVDGRVEAGVHDAAFDGRALNTGSYIATISMAGIESGLSFTKTIKMALMM